MFGEFGRLENLDGSGPILKAFISSELTPPSAVGLAAWNAQKYYSTSGPTLASFAINTHTCAGIHSYTFYS
jgi:hypothetical protein